MHHDHYISNDENAVLGWTHKTCNSKLRLDTRTQIPVNVYAHAIGGIDLNCIYPGFNLADWGTARFSVRGESANTLKGLKVAEVNFRDTYAYYQESLDTLASTMTEIEKARVRNEIDYTLKRWPRFQKTYINLSSDLKERVLDLALKKGLIPYEYLKNANLLEETQFPTKMCFMSVLKGILSVKDEDYERTKEIFELLCSTLGDLVAWYQFLDVILLGTICTNRMSEMASEYGIVPQRYSSMSTYSLAQMFRTKNENGDRPILGSVQTEENRLFFERAMFGGYAATPIGITVASSFLFRNGIEQPAAKYAIRPSAEPDEIKIVEGKIFTTIESFDEHGEYTLNSLKSAAGNFKRTLSFFKKPQVCSILKVPDSFRTLNDF